MDQRERDFVAKMGATIGISALIIFALLLWILSLSTDRKELQEQVEIQAEEIKEKDERIETLRSISIDLLTKDVEQYTSEEESGNSFYEMDETVYVTDTGECYHREDCSSLSESKYPISLGDAVADGYRPCENCDPPTE